MENMAKITIEFLQIPDSQFPWKNRLKKKNCVTEFLHQQSVKRVSF